MKNKKTLLVVLLVLSAWWWQSDTVHALEKNGITYKIDKEDGTAEVIECATSVTGDVVIPEMVNGYRVTEIGDFAFEDCKKITSIIIPEGVTEIGGYVFENCESLSDISLPAYMEEIGECAFLGCTSLTMIELPIGITELEYYTFSNTSLKELHIPYTVEEINKWAFAETDTWEKLVFYGADVDIPSDLKLINEFYSKLTVKIEGFAGSSAESYAKKTGYEFTEIDETHVHTYHNAVKAATVDDKGWMNNICVCGKSKGKTTLYCPKVTFSDVVFEYDGTEKNVTVTVKDAKGDHIDEKYYDVSYPRKSVEIGEYNVSVILKNNYVGKVTCSYRIVDKINLKKPKNVKLVLTEHDGIKLTWDKVEGADGYSVYYKKDGATKYNSVNVKGTKLIRNSLSDNVNYSFKIVPYLLCNNEKIESANYAKKILEH